MCRNLEVPEVRKFEAMLAWAKNKIKTKTSSKVDARVEFKCIMERLARDLKLYRISPQELIKVSAFFCNKKRYRYYQNENGMKIFPLFSHNLLFATFSCLTNF